MTTQATRPGVLLIAHAPLASAFVQVARDMGLPTASLAALDITPDLTREDAFRSAKMLAIDLRCDRWLILVDLGGCCSPYVVASGLRDDLGHAARVVPGLNLAMLATALCAAPISQSLDMLMSHVIARGAPLFPETATTELPPRAPALPTWLESHGAVEAGNAPPLHRFIAAYEPASAELRDEFRAELKAVLATHSVTAQWTTVL